MKKMLCPLLVLGSYAGGDLSLKTGCGGKECAWWDTRKLRCAVVSIAQLGLIVEGMRLLIKVPK